ncbi:C-C chemokine receptor type 3-like [Pelobates cultripes]|uniref:C-C chemokine receptor type 3-like n=2 Tax=Pelobates cultripes TaxID=61616 RepID=A0AAD1W4W8_PELCU|nr:C-C chemokine receptor type 3-like [Pelobates cultripes]
MQVDLIRGPLSNEEKQWRRTHNLCLYCGSAGHYAINCPNKSKRTIAMTAEGAQIQHQSKISDQLDSVTQPLFSLAQGEEASQVTLAIRLEDPAGLIGNTVILVILAKWEKLNSVTNIFILNLVISDLIFTVTFPFTTVSLISHWVFGEIMCKLVTAFFFTGFQSFVIFITLMTIDQYLIIVHSWSSTSSQKVRYAQMISVFAWVTSIIFSVPDIIIYTSIDESFDLPDCSVSSHGLAKWLTVGHYKHFVLFFLLPLLIVIVCYFGIVVKIITSNIRRRDRVLKLIFFIVLFFFVCWSPYNIIMFLIGITRSQPFNNFTNTKTRVGACQLPPWVGALKTVSTSPPMSTDLLSNHLKPCLLVKVVLAVGGPARRVKMGRQLCYMSRRRKNQLQLKRPVIEVLYRRLSTGPCLCEVLLGDVPLPGWCKPWMRARGLHKKPCPSGMRFKAFTLPTILRWPYTGILLDKGRKAPQTDLQPVRNRQGEGLRAVAPPHTHTRSDTREAATWEKRSGHWVLISSSPATGKNTHWTAKDELCGPGAWGLKEADVVSLLKPPSSAHKHRQT